MLYYLFSYLDESYNIPGIGVFQYITFRAGMAIVTSLLISMVFGKTLIDKLRKLQIGETVRDLGLDGQKEKAGTPTMGGLIILGSILIPVLLFAKLNNIYIILLLLTTVWMGTIGFIDDYIKVFKKNKEGLRGIFKVLGQVTLGTIVGSILYFSPDVTIKQAASSSTVATELWGEPSNTLPKFNDAEKSTKTTLPFFKNNEFNYSKLITWISPSLKKYTWLIFNTKRRE